MADVLEVAEVEEQADEGEREEHGEAAGDAEEDEEARLEPRVRLDDLAAHLERHEREARAVADHAPREEAAAREQDQPDPKVPLVGREVCPRGGRSFVRRASRARARACVFEGVRGTIAVWAVRGACARGVPRRSPPVAC